MVSSDSDDEYEVEEDVVEAEIETEPSNAQIYFTVLSDSESEEEESSVECEEASVYFVVKYETDLCFYRVPDDLPPKQKKKQPVPAEGGQQQLLQPEFILKDQQVVRHCCAAVGSVIYVYGGGVDFGGFDGLIMSNRVYFRDTARPKEGWKEGKPMNFARKSASCFSVNNKIYAYGGMDVREYYKVMPMEEYDPAEDEWKIKGLESKTHTLLDFAVYKEGNQVILYTNERKLLAYDVQNSTIEPCTYPIDYRIPISMTVLGNILYMGNYSKDDEGNLELVGYDLNQHYSPAKVTGLEELESNGSDYRLPKRVDYIDGCYSVYSWFEMIPIGEKKLAVVWTLKTLGLQVYVCCLKIEIDVKLTGETQMSLEVQSASFSLHKVTGTCVDHYLPVYYRPRREVDVDTSGLGADVQENEALNANSGALLMQKLDHSGSAPSILGSASMPATNSPGIASPAGSTLGAVAAVSPHINPILQVSVPSVVGLPGAGVPISSIEVPSDSSASMPATKSPGLAYPAGSTLGAVAAVSPHINPILQISVPSVVGLPGAGVPIPSIEVPSDSAGFPSEENEIIPSADLLAYCNLY